MTPTERQAVVLDQLRAAGRALYLEDFTLTQMTRRKLVAALSALEDIGFVSRVNQGIRVNRPRWCYFLTRDGRQ